MFEEKGKGSKPFGKILCPLILSRPLKFFVSLLKIFNHAICNLIVCAALVVQAILHITQMVWDIRIGFTFLAEHIIKCSSIQHNCISSIRTICPPLA